MLPFQCRMVETVHVCLHVFAKLLLRSYETSLLNWPLSQYSPWGVSQLNFVPTTPMQRYSRCYQISIALTLFYTPCILISLPHTMYTYLSSTHHVYLALFHTACILSSSLPYHYTFDDFQGFPVVKPIDRAYKLLVLIRNQESKRILIFRLA